MFHRMKSEAPPTQPQNRPAQNSAPSSAAPPAAPAQNSEAPRFAEFSKNPASEQDKAQAPAAPAQPQGQTRQNQTTPQNQQEDAKPMTTANQSNQNQASGEEFSAPRALDVPVSPYQRPGQAPVRSAAAGAGYPGAYPSAAAYPGRSASPMPAAGERKLIIGRGISISGEIESCDHLIVEGTIEAALKGASILEVAEHGTFYGTVDIEEATIAGRFEGDITVHGRLTIRSTGTITGSIAYKEMEAEAGAVIDGRLTPVGAHVEGRKSQSAKGKKDAKGRDDDGLFSKAAAE